MLLFIVFLSASIFFVIACLETFKEMKKLSTNKEYDEIISNLPDNKSICEEIQKMINTNCEISVDNNSKSSAYIFFLNKIILSNTADSRKNFSRILFIAHECAHSTQDRKLHVANFAFKNIVNIFTIILFIVFFMKMVTLEIIICYFLVAFMSFCFNMILESDAIYRSLSISRKYLTKYNCEKIADRYEYIVSKTISGMYFRYAAPTIYIIFVMTISLIL